MGKKIKDTDSNTNNSEGFVVSEDSEATTSVPRVVEEDSVSEITVEVLDKDSTKDDNLPELENVIVEEQAIENADVTDHYLDDDEEWLKAKDEILESSYDSVLVKQDDAIVFWQIEGLYDDEGKVRSKRSLRNNPPVLKVSDSNGNASEFLLTKELSGTMASHLENTYRAYYGIRPRSELSFKEKVSGAKTWVKANSVKVIIAGLVVAGLVVLGIVF